MSNFRRAWIVLLFTLFLLMPLLLVLLLFWRNLPTDVTDLWMKPDNRAGLIIGIASSVIYTIGASLFLYFRRAVLRWSKALVLRGRSVDEERKRVEQERLYLENFIEMFRRDLPWEVSKYTDLEAIQEDLEKQARRVQPLRRTLPNAEESRIEGNVRARVNVRSFLRNEKGPLMLKGEPGTGKTLTIRRFAVDQAENALKALPDEVKIPVYIFLGTYTQKTALGEPEPVYDFLQHYLQEEYPASGFLREHLTEYLLQGRLLLLFDGLNELPLDEYLPRYKKLEEFVLRKYPKNKAIFTCRTIRYTSLSQFNTIVISDLANDQIKRFISAYRGDDASAILYRELTTGEGLMLRVCRNPFMLQMLVRLDPSRSLPQSPAQLFDEYVHEQLGSVAKNSEEMIDVLRQVAFAMQKDGKFAGAVTSEWLNTQLPNVPQDDLLLIARNTKLLDYSPEKFSFYHQILQEYFAALALRKEWQEERSLESYFTDYRWDDTVLVCAGLVEQAEKFISDIWSPGKTSPDALWLATKAVGISGRHRVSDEYHDRLMQEARRNLGLGGRGRIIGYSPTVLAVDTVKALSYIDDNQTADLLNAVLEENEGWLRELCIQTLGSSRNPYARSLLRSTIINIRPYGDIWLAAPYFSRREWLVILANSVLSFKRLPDYILSVVTGKIKVLFQWLQALFWMVLICLLFLVLDVLLREVHLFRIDLHALSGRLLSLLILLTLLRYRFDTVSKIAHSKEDIKTKLRSLRNELTWIDALLLIPILFLWFFPTETLLLLEFLTIYTWLFIYIVAFITRIKRPFRITSLFYYGGAQVIVLIVITIGWKLLFPSALKITFGDTSSSSVLMPTVILRNAVLLLVSPLVYQLYQILISLIFVATTVTLLVTWTTYWYLRRCRALYLHGNNSEAAIHIRDIALKPSGWPQIRRKAFKELRLIELPSHYVEDLEKLTRNQRDYDVQRELERTIYEIQVRAREKDREGKTVSKRYIRSLANQGMHYRRMGRYEEALANFNQAISLDDKDIEMILERGLTYRTMRRYQEALADFDLALSPNQKDIQTLAIRGETYRQMGHFQEALADLDYIIALDEKRVWPFVGRDVVYRPWPLVRRGEIYQQMNRYQEALTDFTRAITFNKKYAWAIGSRGETYRLMGRYEEALADFDRVLALDEKSIEALANRSITYRLMGRYQEALADLNRALALDEKDDWAIAQRGVTYRQMGRYQEALADFDRAIALGEKNDWYRYRRAQVYMLIGQIKAFESDIQAAIELGQATLRSTPDNCRYGFNLALYHLAAGNVTETESQYTRFASACSSLAQLQEAVDDLTDFLSIQQSNELARHICAQLQAHIVELKRSPVK